MCDPQAVATPLPRNRAPFTLGEVVLLTGGEVLAAPWTAGAVGVSTDSRNVGPGELFVALAGDRFDGHDHARAAADRGARTLVVSRDVDVPGGVDVVRVPDTLVALGDLARGHRRRWAARAFATGQARKVVGITGSAGKTTTRHAVADLLHAALGRHPHASAGNLNNAIGVPLTLLGLGEHHDVAVVEIGMSTPGEIARATSIAEPDVGVVTLVAAAHTEGVGSVYGVMREKSELLAALPRDGIAIANADDALAVAGLMRSRAREHIAYGRSATAGVRLVDRRSLGLHGSEIEVEIAARGGSTRALGTIPLLGNAGVYAALAALSVVVALDRSGASAPADGFGAALSRLGAGESGRLAAAARADGTVIIDDAYNANSASMRASIDAAREIADALGRRLVLVLGPMFELGADSDAIHREIGQYAARARPAVVVVVSGAADELAAAAAKAGAPVVRAVDAASAESRALENVLAGDVVLVKASNSLGLSRVASRLLEEGG